MRKLADSTRALYAQTRRSHVTESIGKLPVDKITPAKVREWYARIPDPAARANAYKIVRSVLGQAVRDHLIAWNSCDIKGGASSPRKPRGYPTAEQVAKIVARMTQVEPRYRFMVLLAASCGLRLAELAGLRRSDIDLEAGTVRIASQLRRVQGVGLVRSGLKWNGEPRVAVLAPSLAVEARSHLERYVPAPATPADGPLTRSTAGNREIELPRSDLTAILTEVARGDAEFLFDDEIAALQQDQHGVDVTFDHAPARRFDLVIGADGFHSGARRLALGPERKFVRHLRMYVATMPLGEPVEHPRDVLLYNTPGRLVSVHPSRGHALVAFIFRGGPIDGLDRRDIEQHKRIIIRCYADAGWRVPEMLQRLRGTPDVYFDSVSQVRLSRWWQGRIALVGDAASCVSLFGDGSSLAMAGAHTLAAALAGESDHATALRRYESEHRVITEPKQRRVGRAAALLVPKTRLGVTVRNVAARAGGTAARLQRAG